MCIETIARIFVESVYFMCVTRNLNICVTRINISITPVGTVISGCHCVHCSCRSGTLCRVHLCGSSEFVSLAIVVSNKYYGLNNLCVNPCGELPITSRHLPSVRGQRDLGRGGTFCVDCPQGA